MVPEEVDALAQPDCCAAPWASRCSGRGSGYEIDVQLKGKRFTVTRLLTIHDLLAAGNGTAKASLNPLLAVDFFATFRPSLYPVLSQSYLSILQLRTCQQHLQQARRKVLQ